MTGRDLETFLARTAALMDAAGGKCGDEVRKLARRLTPFARLTLDQFGDFLVKADAFSRNELDFAKLFPEKQPRPSPQPGKRKEAKPLEPATDPAAVDAAVATLKTLFDRALDPSVTAEVVERAVGPVAKIGKINMFHVAERCGFAQWVSTIKAAQDALKGWILGRKGSRERADL